MDREVSVGGGIGQGPTRDVSRRSFLMAGTSLLVSSAMGACDIVVVHHQPGNRRLTAQPGQPSRLPTLGQSSLGLGTGRDGFLFVPTGYDRGTPLPLIVLLHGGLADAADPQEFGMAADELGAIVLAPESRDLTGVVDGVLPRVMSRDKIIPDLRDEGYLVEYHEFIGGHSVPDEVATVAMEWFMG